MKWIALTLVVGGFSSIFCGFNMDPRASFDDGWFIFEIGLIVGGGIMVIAGVLVFLVDLFMSIG
jgi:hypothetical protein